MLVRMITNIIRSTTTRSPSQPPPPSFARDLHFISSCTIFEIGARCLQTDSGIVVPGTQNFRIVGLKPLSVPYQVVNCDRRFLLLMCRADADDDNGYSPPFPPI